MPGPEEEALRDLVRARETLRLDLMRARHRLSKMLMRHGIQFDDGRVDRPASRMAEDRVLGVAGGADHAAGPGRHDRRASPPPRSPGAGEGSRTCLAPRGETQVGRLRCLRGVDTLTAVGPSAEVGDFERFARAKQGMSYLGLVPSQSTTGNTRRLGSITKTGSAHARPPAARRGGLALP